MSNELKEARRKAQEFVAANLSECCAEEIEWQDTGMLRDGKLREAAKLFGALDKPHAMPLAQREVARQAMRRAAAPSVASGAQDELPPMPTPFFYYESDADGSVNWNEACVCIDDVYTNAEYAAENETHGGRVYSEAQMQAYARAAIAAQAKPKVADEERQEEAHKLARILFGMVEGDGRVEGANIYAEGYSAPDGDVYVLRAAELLVEQAAESKELTRYVEYFALANSAPNKALVELLQSWISHDRSFEPIGLVEKTKAALKAAGVEGV